MCALVRPARVFQALVGERNAGPVRSTFWMAVRRPVFLTLVIACVVSLLATSVATLRLVGPTALYWSFVPVVEILALTIVLWSRRNSQTLASLVDVFFVGHAAWTLFLLLFGAALALSPPQHWWFLVTRPAIAGIVLAAGWSAYVDVCFFRYVCGATLSSAIGSAALFRVIAWIVFFWIFAVPEPTPLGVIQELVAAFKDLRQ